MLITKTNPTGKDWYIQQAQTKLHERLTTVWGITDTYSCYGRAYRNKKKDGYVAEVYTVAKDYKDVYLDDKLAALSFFGVGQKAETEKIGASIDVHLIFFITSLKLLKPSLASRGDEEVQQDVINALHKNSFGLSFQSIETGIDNILREYPGSAKGLLTADMHPKHCFRLNYKLNYDINKC